MDRKIIDSLSKTTAEERESLFKWFTAQGDVVRVAVIREQGELASRNKSEYQKAYRGEFYYAVPSVRQFHSSPVKCHSRAWLHG